MRWHRHKWRDIPNTRRFIPPIRRSFEGAPPSQAERYVFGFTTVEQECRVCPTQRIVTIGLGDLT